MCHQGMYSLEPHGEQAFEAPPFDADRYELDYEIESEWEVRFGLGEVDIEMG